MARLKQTETAPFRVASVLPLQPAYAYAQGLESADGWANLYPKIYREYWLRVLAPLFKNVPGAKNIFDPDIGKPQDHYIFLGADLVHPTVGALPGEDAAKAIRTGFDVDQRYDLKLLGLLNVKYILSEFPLQSSRLELVHEPGEPPATAYSRDWATGLLSPPSGLRVTSVFRKAHNAVTDLMESMRRKSNGKDVYIYRLVNYVSRFRFAKQIRIEASGRAVLD